MAIGEERRGRKREKQGRRDSVGVDKGGVKIEEQDAKN